MPARSQNFAWLESLAAARAHAAHWSCDPWQFALELEALGRLGASYHELRWSVAEGLSEHRLEITTPDCPERRFRPLANLALPAGTCFVLTDKGAAWLAEHAAPATDAGPLASPLGNGHAAAHPSWDRHHRVLKFGEEVVKSFRVPAANQEAILWAFEAAGWPPCIADPLNGDAEQEPRQRLAYAIKALNRSQVHKRLRFFGDGTGRRVCWKLIALPRRHLPPNRTRIGT